MRAINVAIVANYPSHYCVDVFNHLSRHTEFRIKVFYLRRLTPGRQWNEIRPIQHDHEFVPEWRIHRTFYLNPGLVRRVLAFRPDWLIVTQYASIGMQVLMYLFSMLRRPWVFWSEAPGVRFSEMPALHNEWLRRVFRAVAILPVRFWPQCIWGVGATTTRDYQRISRAHCINVPYYFDQTPFLAIQRSNSSPDPLRLLFSGKLIFRKGFDLLLDALLQIVDRRNEFHLTVLGDGPDKILVEKLPRELRERIDMLGFREVREVPAVYASCDVLVLPSRYDGWGLAVIEAMAAEMPVVASNAAVAVQDAVEDGITGFTFDPTRPSNLAAALQRMLDAKNQVRAMGVTARGAATRYDAAGGARRIANLLSAHDYRT